MSSSATIPATVPAKGAHPASARGAGKGDLGDDSSSTAFLAALAPLMTPGQNGTGTPDSTPTATSGATAGGPTAVGAAGSVAGAGTAPGSVAAAAVAAATVTGPSAPGGPAIAVPGAVPAGVAGDVTAVATAAVPAPSAAQTGVSAQAGATQAGATVSGTTGAGAGSPSAASLLTASVETANGTATAAGSPSAASTPAATAAGGEVTARDTGRVTATTPASARSAGATKGSGDSSPADEKVAGPGGSTAGATPSPVPVSGDAQPQQPPSHDMAGMPSAPLDVPATVAAPAAATGPAASVAAGPSPAPTAAPAMPHQQVLTAVSPLLRGPDGGHQLQLQLRPHELGTVNVTVDVSHGEVTIRLHAADDAARDLLRDHLPDLRHQLEEQGLRAGTLEVGTGGPDAQQWRPRDGQTSPGGTRAPAAGPGNENPTDPAATAGAAQAAPGALDLRM